MTEAVATAFTETGRASSLFGCGLVLNGGEIAALLGRECSRRS